MEYHQCPLFQVSLVSFGKIQKCNLLKKKNYGLHCCCCDGTANYTANVDKSSSLLCGELIQVSDTFKPCPHHMRSNGNSIALC